MSVSGGFGGCFGERPGGACLGRVLESGLPGRFRTQGVGQRAGMSWDKRVSALRRDGQVVALCLVALDSTEAKAPAPGPKHLARRASARKGL